ncbi:MAG: hypothetical protein K8U03_08780 [Planctomycetia bacterium]|nr:hypothetical protein [Planctomycetia bacterium]
MPATKIKRRSTRTVAPKHCSICNASGDETFRFLRKTFIFDVDLARKLTQDGREAVLLDRDDVRYAVDSSIIHEQHVPHVDVRYPGIMARVRYTETDGSIVTGDVLIDGHHRAARCLQMHRPFTVYILTYEETDRVLKIRPDAARRRRRRTGPRRRRA